MRVLTCVHSKTWNSIGFQTIKYHSGLNGGRSVNTDLMVAVALGSASAGLNRVLLKWRGRCNLPQDR
jgi:hypothetical protein